MATQPTSEQPAETITVCCDHCGADHTGEFSHDRGRGEGPIYAVVCTEDDLTAYYTLWAAK